MNKIFNINMGGTPFMIDEDAYYNLKLYIDTIKNHFKTSDGYEDIVYDIEIRIGELFTDCLRGKQIVSQKDLETVISIMGRPEDFGAENTAFDEQFNQQKKSAKSKYTETGEKYRTGKRLFRDKEDKMIAGVASGLSHYLGLSDPLWIRIIFALLIFTGLGPIPYVILWIIVPYAKTSADKLSMTGEQVNITSIANKVEEELGNLADKISDFSASIGKKKDGPK